LDSLSGFSPGLERWAGIFAIFAFALALLTGWFFEGRAAKVSEDKFDALMGQLSNFCVGLFFLGILGAATAVLHGTFG
jgi:hypothetical protein